QRDERRVRACAPRRGRRGVGEAAAAERGDGDRGGHARPRLPRGRRQGRPDPRAHGWPPGPPGGGARATRARMMLDPEVETRPWAEQLALDDASFREQLAYLLERSLF